MGRSYAPSRDRTFLSTKLRWDVLAFPHDVKKCTPKKQLFIRSCLQNRFMIWSFRFIFKGWFLVRTEKIKKNGSIFGFLHL